MQSGRQPRLLPQGRQPGDGAHDPPVLPAALTIDAADPAALADFWGQALGLPVLPAAVAGDSAIDVAGLRMILHNPAGTGTSKNSIRPVLVTDQYDEEIARLTAWAPSRSTSSSSRPRRSRQA